MHMFPAPDIPVVEVAIPFVGPARLFEFGQALAPLRDATSLHAGWEFGSFTTRDYVFT